MSSGFGTGYELYSLGDAEQFLPNIKESLAKLHTRALMDLRISALGRHDPEFNALIKEELSTREHIPNKMERRISRQQKMKERQNR